ncbi:MAG: hypothetical protein IAE82_02020 [Opitutaceae bacterium]|nr:hypothetical protein [Opitutaceae bacterium]
MSTSPSFTPTPAPTAPRRSPWRAMIVWFVGVSVASMLVAVPYLVVSSLRLERETVRLRDAVVGSLSGHAMEGWSPRIEVRLGTCAFGLARLVTRCADLPDEARQALRAARSASVGVYQWRGADIAAMRRHMAGGQSVVRVGGREWTRVVCVRDGDESVVVLTPVTDDDDPSTLELCVVVLADGELVVVAVEVDPQPLSDLVQPHLRDLRGEVHDAV